MFCVDQDNWLLLSQQSSLVVLTYIFVGTKQTDTVGVVESTTIPFSRKHAVLRASRFDFLPVIFGAEPISKALEERHT